MTDNSSVASVVGNGTPPEPFFGTALSASLTVKDIHKSLAWYQEVLGFTADKLFERKGELRAASLKAGQVRILIGQDNGAKGWDRVKGEGFSLQISTAQDAYQLAQRIQARGGALDLGPTATPWGAIVFRLRDPDGFRLTISSGD